MALTKDQWLIKIKRLVQTWVSERPDANAVLSGIAAVLAEQQKSAEDHVNETFIDLGSDEYVELQGDERSVTRLPGEGLSSYRQRVKMITNQSNVPALKQLVDAILIRGTSTFIEHYAATNFLNRGAFLNRNIIDYDVLYNAFTILIDYQIPEPTSFLNRGAFLNREFLNGSSISSDAVFKNIIEAVNKNKAYGTVYRLIERANP